MSKAVLYGVVGIVIVGAIAAWAMTSGRAPSGRSENNSASSPNSAMTMRELMASNVSQKCDFSEPQSNTSGTVYIANGKVRGDFTSQVNGKPMMGHMIADSSSSHVWMDGMAQGFKTTFTAQATSSSNSQQGLDPDRKTDYKCTAWTADAALFVVPTNIKFMDPGAMMGGASGGASGSVSGSASQCAMCDQAPASARAQCRAALHCE